jgi:hypothetical protein
LASIDPDSSDTWCLDVAPAERVTAESRKANMPGSPPPPPPEHRPGMEASAGEFADASLAGGAPPVCPELADGGAAPELGLVGVDDAPEDEPPAEEPPGDEPPGDGCPDEEPPEDGLAEVPPSSSRVDLPPHAALPMTSKTTVMVRGMAGPYHRSCMMLGRGRRPIDVQRGACDKPASEVGQ